MKIIFDVEIEPYGSTTTANVDTLYNELNSWESTPHGKYALPSANFRELLSHVLTGPVFITKINDVYVEL